MGASFSSAAKRLLVLATRSSLDWLLCFVVAEIRAGVVEMEEVEVVLFLRFANIGDAFSTIETKFEGNTPILAPNLPRHQPSSTWNITQIRKNMVFLCGLDVFDDDYLSQKFDDITNGQC